MAKRAAPPGGVARRAEIAQKMEKLFDFGGERGAQGG